MKRTKIVCTIGPSSNKVSILKSMMRSGMDVARLNFSHGTHADHKELIKSIRSASKDVGKTIAIMGDLQGPKIRLGKLPKQGVELKSKSTVVFTTATNDYKKGVLPVTYKNLHKDVKAGSRMLIDDGLIEAKVLKVSGKKIYAQIINGGLVTSHKGMNFPDATLKVSAITEKDKEDLIFGVQNDVDFIALSFVTSAKEVNQLKVLIKKASKKKQTLPLIIVKIEKHEAIDNFDEILEATDAVMVARGDLGVETPAEEVPIRQKEIIEKCRFAGKPVVVATQMLDSMIRNPRPTRAEVSDVANAVFDHTDAVMLSGESASGKYPLKAVKMMSRTIEESENSEFDDVPFKTIPTKNTVEAFSNAIKLMALQGSIDGVIALHDSAPWAETLLRTHPEIPLFLATSNETIRRQLVIRWGLRPFVLKNVKEKTFVHEAIKKLIKQKKIKKGTKLAIVKEKGFDHVTIA
jgi:pyruvate kinase